MASLRPGTVQPSNPNLLVQPRRVCFVDGVTSTGVAALLGATASSAGQCHATACSLDQPHSPASGFGAAVPGSIACRPIPDDPAAATAAAAARIIITLATPSHVKKDRVHGLRSAGARRTVAVPRVLSRCGHFKRCTGFGGGPTHECGTVSGLKSAAAHHACPGSTVTALLHAPSWCGHVCFTCATRVSYVSCHHILLRAVTLETSCPGSVWES